MSLCVIDIKKLIARLMFERGLAYLNITAELEADGQIKIISVNGDGAETMETDWVDREGAEA